MPSAAPVALVTIAERLEADLKEALRARDALRTSTVRLARAAMKNAEIDRRRALTEAEATDVIQREVKRRREAIEAFERGGRADLVEKETAEREVLNAYAPVPLSETEVDALIDEALAATGASGPQEMGKVMGFVMGKAKGKVDGAAVQARVRARLGDQA